MPHKKSHKKTVGRKGRKSAGRRTVKKGGYYGFSGQVGTGAPLWSTAQEVGLPSHVTKGARRRKTRKTRKVRGGDRFQSATAGYTGTGARGIADYVDVGSTKGPSALGAFNVKSS
jgi:hypothetical protein